MLTCSQQTASDCFTTVLVGNKCDKKMVRCLTCTVKKHVVRCDTVVLMVVCLGVCFPAAQVVSQAEGEAIAKRLGMKFFLASAKSDINVKEVLVALKLAVSLHDCMGLDLARSHHCACSWSSCHASTGV